MRLRLAGAAVVAAIALATSCAGDGGGSDGAGTDLGIRLDGSPRVPDVEGLATRVTREGITIDGRTYRFAPTLKAFNTYTLALEPVVSREGQLVHVGLDGDVAVWVAGIGAPIGDPPTVVYAGTLLRIEDGRAVMRDGTTFPVPDDDVVHATSGDVQVRLDPATGRVRDLRPT